MIDLHTHPIPGIDDGVRDEDEALELCRIAVREGITTLVATPHMRTDLFPNDRDGILKGVERLRALLRREEIDLQIAPGAEVYLEPDLIDRMRAGHTLTLNDGGAYLLLELPARHLPAGVDDVIYRLRLAGVTPVIAHPERLLPLQEDPERFARLVELGALGQLTAGSLLGQFGSTALRISRLFLERGLVQVLASDAHNSANRAPLLREALAQAEALIGKEAAQRSVHDVPRAILAGEEIEVAMEPGEEPARRGGWLDWLRGRERE
ncbi:MAG: hypothetical protein O7F16_02785 [Acidobacteria bacterium]|nr:hypothetical protein [Acidobacteriota bacterium]